MTDLAYAALHMLIPYHSFHFEFEKNYLTLEKKSACFWLLKAQSKRKFLLMFCWCLKLTLICVYTQICRTAIPRDFLIPLYFYSSLTYLHTHKQYIHIIFLWISLIVNFRYHHTIIQFSFMKSFLTRFILFYTQLFYL